MKTNQKKKKRKFLTVHWNLLILVTFAILSLLSVGLIRTKLLKNMQEMGEILTRNYSAEQQNNITVYQTMLELGVAYIDEPFDFMIIQGVSIPLSLKSITLAP